METLGMNKMAIVLGILVRGARKRAKGFLLISLLSVSQLGYALEVTLEWTDNSDNESGFGVERSEDGGDFVQIGTVGADVTSYTDSEVEFGIAYEYRVNAFNDFGTSTYTNSVVSQEINTAPTIAGLSDIQFDENTQSTPITLTIEDSHTDSEALILSATSTNSNLIETGGIVIAGTGANRTLSLSPIADAFGTSTISIVVSDGILLTTKTFVVTVNEVVPDEPDIPELLAAPSILPGSGAFAGIQLVEILSSEIGANVYYTLDGSEPSLASSLYEGVFEATSDLVIRAIAIDPTGTKSNSQIASSAVDLSPWSIQNDWYSIETAAQENDFSIEFSCKPLGVNVDWVVGLSTIEASHWNDLALNVLFSNTGKIQVRSGSEYIAGIEYAYEPNVEYDFKIDANIATRAYDVRVKTGDGSWVKLIEGAAFRTEVAEVSILGYVSSYATNSIGGIISDVNLMSYQPGFTTDESIVENLRSKNISNEIGIGSTTFEDSIEGFKVSDLSGAIDGTMDTNRYAYLFADGNASLTARLSELQDGSDQSVAGLMIRDTLRGSSPEISILVDKLGRLLVRSRSEEFGETVEQLAAETGNNITFLRVERSDSTLLVAGSVDGSSWNELGSIEAGPGSKSFVGMAVAGDSQESEALAVFNNVEFEGSMVDYGTESTIPALPSALIISSVLVD